MKRFLLIVLSIMLVLCMALACGCESSCNGEDWGIPELPNTSEQVLTLSTGTKTLIIGESFTLKVSGVDGTPEFNSDTENVATVNQGGLVTAVGVGEATIKVSASGQSKNCYIKVIEDTRIPTLRFNNVAKENGKYVLPIASNEVYALDFDIIFGGAFVEGAVSFESQDESILTVDENGVVTVGNVSGNSVETIIKVNATYNGKYSEDLYTEITVLVTDAKWNFALDSKDAIYAIDTFGGVSYKNTVGYTASLTVGGQIIDESDILVTCEDGHFEVNGNVITAKKAGVGYVKLSYVNGANVYERFVPVNVERVVDDRNTNNAVTFVRYEDVASLARFDKFADDRATEKVFIVSENSKTELKVENGKYVGVDNGINYVEIQNDIFSVQLQVHFTDYYFGRIDSLLYQYTLDEDGDGDIENQSIVLPESFAEQSVRYFAIYREGGLHTSGGVKQMFAIEDYDAQTRTLTLAKTWRDAYWFWYTGDVMFTVVTDSSYYMGEITAKNATKEPDIDTTNRTYYAGDLYNGEVAYLERWNDAPEEQSFVLPESFGHVSDFKIVGIVDTVYNQAERTITVKKSELSTLTAGVKIATFIDENGNNAYCYLTVAEFIVRSNDDVFKLASTDANQYIVLAADVDAAESSGITPSTWRNYYTGTIDGKGHTVSNLSLVGNAWWGFIYQNFSGTMKDIAFVNMHNASGAVRGLIAHQVNGAVLENVYISGTAYREHLFETIQDKGVTLNNVVLNFEDGWGEKGVISKNVDGLSTGEATCGEHFYNIYDDDDFFSEHDGLKFGLFEVKNGGLYFNEKLVAIQSNIDLTKQLIDGSLGYVGSNTNREVQELKLPCQIPGIEKVTKIDIDIWGNGNQYRNLAVTYNAENNSFNVTPSAVNAILADAYSGKFFTTCKIVTGYSTYWAKIDLLGVNAKLNFISTKAELESYLTAENFIAGQFYVLTNDIDGAVVENKSNTGNGIVAHFDGRGYSLTNLTINGYGLLGNYFNGTFKNTIVKVSSVQTETKGLISGQSANCNMSNIYVEADTTGSNALSVFRGVYSGCSFANMVINVKGVDDVFSGTPATEENVVTVTETFFTDNASLNFGSFAMTEQGLTFNGKLVYAKA